MKTLIYKVKTNEELDKVIYQDSLICSSMYRFAFCRFQDRYSSLEIYRLINEKFQNVNCHLRNSALRAANGLFKRVKDKKTYFGNFKRFQKGLISKEDFKESKLMGIMSEGEFNQKGNRLFQIDIVHSKFIYKRKCKEHYDLEIDEKLSEKRKTILARLQLLMSEKKIPVTFRLKKDKLFITYDESVVEKEKQFKNLFNNRVLGIDLNPNYFGISIIEFNRKDNFKVIHKECIDVSELQEQDKNKIKFELYEINHHLLKLCKHWHVSKVSVEDLNFSNKKKFWNKKLNRLCRNNFRFSIIKSHLQTLCNTYGVEFIEVNAAYSSIEGNFIHGNENTPDMIAASIEIARRAYHKFEKGWFQPRIVTIQRLKQVLGNQWKEELGLGYQSWKGLAEEIKKFGLKYKFQLNSLNAVFRTKYNKRYVEFLTFFN